MRVPMVQVDAFSRRPLGGNPAAVCRLESWPPDAQMLAIAAENNLSETAFVRRRPDGDWDLRWFTPTVEVSLCGHATLGAGFAVRHWGEGAERIVFHTLSGPLTVEADGDRLVMDFPAVPTERPVVDVAIEEALGCDVVGLWQIREVHFGRYLLAEVADEAAVRDVAPDIAAIGALRSNVIVTARGDDVDVVSRFFAPASGVPEDPVTGSAHCTLAVFWAERLGRAALHCRQISSRAGDVWTEVVGDRVKLAGYGALFLEGTAHLPDAE